MRKLTKIFLYSLTVIILMLGLCYLGLAYYYGNKFISGTYVNGIYCTGKSIEELNLEFQKSTDLEDLTVTTNQNCFTISPEEIELSADYQKPLQEFLSSQNSIMWITRLFHNQYYHLHPVIHYDEKKLWSLIQKNCMQDQSLADNRVYLIATPNGFFLHDLDLDVLDGKLAVQLIQEALNEGETQLNLVKMGCYRRRCYTDEEKKLIDFYHELCSFEERNIRFHFGNEVENFTKEQLIGCLRCTSYFNERRYCLPVDYQSRFYEKVEKTGEKDKQLAIDPKKVRQILEDFFQPYHTYQHHEFLTHDGRTIEINGGTYGNEILIEKEVEGVFAFLRSFENTYDRHPEYRTKALYQGKDDIGSTYIEVDMGLQKLYYFEKGKLLLETDVVTGKNSCTDECVCYLYGKQKNRVLRGENYATFVKYWMPVIRSIGIHDSSWRSEYGGDIYKRSGSHGCINTPLKAVEQLYERVEIGTPVILYYGLS